MHANGDALRQAHPSEDWVDRCDPLIVGLRIGDADRSRDTIDVTAHDWCVSHQLDLSPIADLYGSKARLFEIPVNPE